MSHLITITVAATDRKKRQNPCQNEFFIVPAIKVGPTKKNILPQALRHETPIKMSKERYHFQ